MSAEFTKKDWEEYCGAQKETLAPLLSELGYSLETSQPHTLGERFLTRPISGGRKLVWLARGKSGERVVIKTSDEPRGIQEIEEEHASRIFLERIGFAYESLHYPKELFCGTLGNHHVLIAEFIEQECPFLSRPLEEQFSIALTAFKTQESAHATTYSHQELIRKKIEVMTGERYCEKGQRYAHEATVLIPKDTALYAKVGATTTGAREALCADMELLEQYGDFLTHWDFTPQNFRVRNNELYLLDHGSIRFGNKYEGWARFVNFMELYNPPLARVLLQYVKDNRTPEESGALWLMRIFRLMELIRYYASWLSRTEGDLHELTLARITFWTSVLQCVLENTNVPGEIIETYKNTRDSLRSEDEKERQKDLH